MTTILTSRETATVLAALRLLQEQQVLGTTPARITAIASGGGQFQPLPEHEVHELAQRLAGVSNPCPERATPRSPIQLQEAQA